MQEHDFANRLRSMFNIDGFQLAPELTEMEQQAFMRDPVGYYIRCPDPKRLAIWREIEKRQQPIRAINALAAHMPEEAKLKAFQKYIELNPFMTGENHKDALDAAIAAFLKHCGRTP